MRVLLVNTSENRGGAAVACNRLMLALKRACAAGGPARTAPKGSALWTPAFFFEKKFVCSFHRKHRNEYY